jgi:predicted aspartyl protease
MCSALGVNWRGRREEDTTVAGGSVASREVVLKEVAVGPFTRRNVATLVIELNDPEVGAILGWSFLGSFAMSIDPSRGMLELEGVRKRTLARRRGIRRAMVM